MSSSRVCRGSRAQARSGLTRIAHVGRGDLHSSRRFNVAVDWWCTSCGFPLQCWRRKAKPNKTTEAVRNNFHQIPPIIRGQDSHRRLDWRGRSHSVQCTSTFDLWNETCKASRAQKQPWSLHKSTISNSMSSQSMCRPTTKKRTRLDWVASVFSSHGARSFKLSLRRRLANARIPLGRTLPERASVVAYHAQCCRSYLHPDLR